MPQIGTPIIIDVFEIDPHAGKGAAALGIRNTRFQSNLLEFLAAKIMKEEVGMIVIGHKYVYESITIVVGDGDSHAFPEVLGDSSFYGNIGEGAVAVVAVQSIREIRIIVGMAICTQLGSRAAVWVLINLPLAVIRHEQVQQAVIVVIDPGCRHGPHLFAIEKASTRPGFVGNIGKGAVPVVVQQLIPSHVYDVDVGPAIIVIVANSYAHAIADTSHTCCLGYIG